MDKQARKSAIAQYKERKAASGIFAMICTSTGEVWVGKSNNLDAQWNGLSYSLRLGTSPFKSLQEAWSAHGEKEFRFEELDRLADDFSAMLRLGELKKRQKLWSARLQASPL